MSEKKVIKAMKESGLTDAEIKSELAGNKKLFEGFAKSPEIVAMLTARDHGVPVEKEGILGKWSSTPEKMLISDIASGMKDKSVTTSGFIIGKKKGKTKSNNPKVTLTLTDNGSIIRASIFDAAYESYKEQKFDFFDKVKFTNAKIFEFDSESGDETVSMLTCGRFTVIEKLHKDITKYMTHFPEAESGTMCVSKGIVIETKESSYTGCPECSRKNQSKDPESEMECECGYNGEPTECNIVRGVVSDGEETSTITMFPRMGYRAKDIAFKPVVVVGKKSDDGMNVNAIRIYDVNKKHKEYFDEDEPLDEVEKPKKSKVSSDDKKALYIKIKNSLEMFPSGIGRDGLIEIVKAKENVKRKKVIKAIDSLIEKNEITEDDEHNLSLSDEE